MPYPLRTRIAPTPSGLLHVGNAWSFALTWLAARSRGGHVHLRIDDLDAARFREEYLEDIFESLRWLGLDWDSGPRDAADFHAAHSQRLRLDSYREALARLDAQGCLYACTCSREQIRQALESAGSPATKGYPGTCRDKGLDKGLNKDPDRELSQRPAAGGTDFPALRYRVPRGGVRMRDAEGIAFDLHPDRDMGDFVLRQKNGDPGYQIASVVDDEEAGINFVVRGLDLLPSTGAQLSLASALGFKGLEQARFWHHALVLDDAGDKLSKSRDAESLRQLREKFPSPAPLYRAFASALGLSAEHVASARDLLPGFQAGRVAATPLHLSDIVRALEG